MTRWIKTLNNLETIAFLQKGLKTMSLDVHLVLFMESIEIPDNVLFC